jgi:hypothetical protein
VSSDLVSHGIKLVLLIKSSLTGGVSAVSTNTLAAKTASMAGSQTMFEMCSETRRRLRRVAGYDRFIGQYLVIDTP